MARHPFRLASVLSLREAQLSVAGSEVNRIEFEVQSLTSTRRQIESERGETRSIVADERLIVAADLRIAADYLESLDRADARLRDEEELARRRLDSARSVLVERHQAVSMLQRLRDRMNVVADTEERRGEQKALDDVAGSRSYRRRTK